MTRRSVAYGPGLSTPAFPPPPRRRCVAAALSWTALVAACTEGPNAAPDVTVTPRPFWIAVEEVHQELTRTALSFLRRDVLEGIVTANRGTDLNARTEKDSRYHFDDCRFQEATTLLNQQYETALAGVTPLEPGLPRAQTAFGQILHAVQDFYSHTNWVETGATSLVDEGLGPWRILTPYAPVAASRTLVRIPIQLAMVVVQNAPRAGFTLPPGALRGKQVVVSRTDGTSRWGLISGTVEDAWVPDPAVPGGRLPATDCPNQTSLPHGDKVNWRATDLHKDAFLRPGHPAAAILATRQTRHEFCRLLSLVGDRFGEVGRELLLAAWVADRDAALIACGRAASSGVDMALILDSSGSMGWNDPRNDRLAAAHAYASAAPTGDSAGVVDFDDAVRASGPLHLLPAGRPALRRAIDSVDASGGTNIGAGVRAACELLAASTRDRTTKAAILLTDGQGAFSEDHQCFVDRGWPIFTFGFGDADDLLLARIATETRGEFRRLPTSNLVCEFQRVRAKVARAAPGPCSSHQVMPNATTSLRVHVPPAQAQASFSTSWPGSDVVTTLTAPSGRTISRDIASSDVAHAVGPTFEVYTVTAPESGEWTVALFGADVPPAGEPVVFGLSHFAPANRPPLADAGADQAIECAGPEGTPVSLDARASRDPEAAPLLHEWSSPTVSFEDPTRPVQTLRVPLGSSQFSLFVADDGSLGSSDEVAVTVQDTSPPALSLSAAPTILWPPNQRYVTVTLTTRADDRCSPIAPPTATVRVTEARGNTPRPHRHLAGAIRITRPNGEVILSSGDDRAVAFRPTEDRLELRAERPSTACHGRAYLIEVQAVDGAGNATKRTLTVPVERPGRR